MSKLITRKNFLLFLGIFFSLIILTNLFGVYEGFYGYPSSATVYTESSTGTTTKPPPSDVSKTATASAIEANKVADAASRASSSS